MEQKHIIVNYHYVEDPHKEWGGIHPCSIGEFDRQIKYLKDNYKIVSIEEVYKASEVRNKDAYATITFDDGLKDQYINALPILEKYGATAAFFPITSTFTGNIPATHKLHILLSKKSAEELIDIFHAFGTGIVIPKDKRMADERQIFSDICTANLKETLLLMLPEQKNTILMKFFVKLGLKEKDAAKDFFMTAEEVKDLDKKGFSIGSHTHGHYSLNSLSPEDFAFEIKESRRILGELLGKFPAIISYPHGIKANFNTYLLKQEGFKYGFSIENRALKAGENPFFLPRLDTNDLKNAK